MTDHVRQLHEPGYAIVRGPFPPGEMAAVAAAAKAVYAEAGLRDTHHG